MNPDLPIALDAMGGDNAPACVIHGMARALRQQTDLRFLLYGDEKKLQPLLDHHPSLQAAMEFFHTPESVGANDKPSTAVRQGRNTSMALAINAVKEGRASAVVSAGNTGALMAISKITLKTLPGISRPAISGLLPTMKGACVMLDLGANVMCDANDLYQFAIMGDAFARSLLDRKEPQIGLLNVGSEEMKGHEEVKAAAALLKGSKAPLHFYGFVEGNDITQGTVDVVVTDGFTGNIALKTAEGTAKMILGMTKQALLSTRRARMGAFLARPALRDMRSKMDPRTYNGAMFLGLNGIVIKSHGSADAHSFAQAIKVADTLVKHRINQRITEEIRMSEAPNGAGEPKVLV